MASRCFISASEARYSLHRAHGLEVHPQQLAQGAALAQPGMGRALRGRMRQAPDDRAHRRRAQRPVDSQLGQKARQAQLRQRPQSDLLDAHASRARQFQGIDVHRLNVARRRRLVRRFRRRRRGPSQQLRGDALGLLLDRCWRVVKQRRLAVEDLVDALAQ